MAVRTAERRRSNRLAAAYTAVVTDQRGRVLARGRTANISENGCFVIARRREGPPPRQCATIEMVLPAAGATRPGRTATRTILYHCRIIRTQPLGQLVGMGIELLDKIR